MGIATYNGEAFYGNWFEDGDILSFPHAGKRELRAGNPD